MSRKAYVATSIAVIGFFGIGLISGLLIASSVVQDGPVTMRGDQIEIATTNSDRVLRLSKRAVNELSYMNAELREAEVISRGLWEMLFSDCGGTLQVKDHPNILEVAILLKAGEGQIDYGRFFHSVNID